MYPNTYLVLAINGREVEQVTFFTYLDSLKRMSRRSQEGKWGLRAVVFISEE